MIDALVFPDARSCLFDLINGAEHLGQSVRAFYYLPADAITGDTDSPLALIYLTGGTEGYVDRVDRATIEAYAPGERALQTLESIRASIVGDSIETPSGYVDAIRVVTAPVEAAPYSDTLNRATMAVDVISRPL